MNNTIIKILVFLVSLIITIFFKPNTLADTQVGEIKFTDCTISDESERSRTKAECAYFRVPENYAEPEGKKIDLYVARIKASKKLPEADPITLIAGGPGQGAVKSYAPLLTQFRTLSTNRDIYLIDQRGTGKSKPLQCPDMADPEIEFDEELTKKLTLECLNSLSVDTRFYNTSVAVKDLDAIRIALGIEQWNLLGISYGTRVALHYLRKYPDSARTTVIDGVAPPDWNLGANMPFDRQNTLEQMFIRCESDPACNESIPNLRNGVNKLVEELKLEAKQIKVENINNGKIEDFKFTAQHLIGLVAQYTYSPTTVSILPIILHEAYANNNFAPIARQVLLQKDAPPPINMGMFLSAICTEDFPFYAKDDIDIKSVKETFFGIDTFNNLKFSCSVWPRGIIDEDFKYPVVSDKPVLLLSGTADPVTPPRNAEQVKQHLKNSLHIVGKDYGHGLTPHGCTIEIITKFIQTASTEGLEYDCVNDFKAEPLFLNVNGPVK